MSGRELEFGAVLIRRPNTSRGWSCEWDYITCIASPISVGCLIQFHFRPGRVLVRRDKNCATSLGAKECSLEDSQIAQDTGKTMAAPSAPDEVLDPLTAGCWNASGASQADEELPSPTPQFVGSLSHQGPISVGCGECNKRRLRVDALATHDSMCRSRPTDRLTC